MTRKKASSHRKAFVHDTDGNSIEDIILRSHRKTQIDPTLPLEKKSNDPEILRSLLEIERVILKKAREKGII
ncbi:MAG TPA: hypothetical protein VEL47_03635 [Myxococcota bacterium]|nr:hypothetical protein [Myxococcota bacterium]